MKQYFIRVPDCKETVEEIFDNLKDRKNDISCQFGWILTPDCKIGRVFYFKCFISEEEQLFFILKFGALCLIDDEQFISTEYFVKFENIDKWYK